VREDISTPEGRKWWKDNGSDLYHAKSDLHEWSWLRYDLDEYSEKKIKGQKCDERQRDDKTTRVHSHSAPRKTRRFAGYLGAAAAGSIFALMFG
jgi:hypothetical protein